MERIQDYVPESDIASQEEWKIESERFQRVLEARAGEHGASLSYYETLLNYEHISKGTDREAFYRWNRRRMEVKLGRKGLSDVLKYTKKQYEHIHSQDRQMLKSFKPGQ